MQDLKKVLNGFYSAAPKILYSLYQRSQSYKNLNSVLLFVLFLPDRTFNIVALNSNNRKILHNRNFVKHFVKNGTKVTSNAVNGSEMPLAFLRPID